MKIYLRLSILPIIITILLEIIIFFSNTSKSIYFEVVSYNVFLFLSVLILFISAYCNLIKMINILTTPEFL